MLKRLYHDCFLLNLKDYANIGVNFYINIFLLVVFVVLGASFFFINYQRGCMVLTVKQLIRHGAENEDSAKTLSSLGLGGHKGIMMMLSRDGQLKRIVTIAGEKKYSYEEYVALMKAKKLPKEKIDFENARLYIAESEMSRAKNVYENYNSSVVRTVLYCILLLALYICCLLVMPEVLRIVDSFLGRFVALTK